MLNNGWVLRHKKNLKTVAQNEVVAGRGGEKYMVTGFRIPLHEASSGRVCVARVDGSYEAQYFPHVFDLEVVHLETESQLINQGA